MQEEATSVLAWFEHYVRIYDDVVAQARPSRTLLQLLCSAFPLLYQEVVDRRIALGADEWACVIALLETFYETELHIDRTTLNDEIKLEAAQQYPEVVRVLEYSVSAVVQCDDKASFVRDIMSMDDSVQVDIMAVIERVMVTTTAQSSTAIVETDQEQLCGTPRRTQDHSLSHHSLGTPASTRHDDSFAQTPQRPVSTAEFDRLKRENDILKQDSIFMSTELTDIKSKVDRLESENSSLRKCVEDLQLQSEMDLLKRERQVRGLFEERLHAIQHDLERATAELEEKTAAAAQVVELRDEVDLLRPAAEKLIKAEATLGKYKEKIEELSVIKEKLRRSEEANVELVEKNLALESQAAKMSLLQRKLADSKEANTAIQFQVSELQTQLARLSADLEIKRLECHSSSAALTEAQQLNQQLQLALKQHVQSVESNSSPLTSGSAEAIGELNPELMEKLARLEHENISLRSQLDGSTTERIDALTDEIEDITRMKKSFEARYFETSESLKETEAKLAAAELREKHLKDDLESSVNQLQTTIERRDDLQSQLMGAQERISQLISCTQAQESELDQRRVRECCLDQELQETQSQARRLQASTDELSQLLIVAKERNQCLQEDVEAHVLERSQARLERSSLSQTIKTLVNANDNQRDEIQELGAARHFLEGELRDAHHQHMAIKEEMERIAMQNEDIRCSLLSRLEEIQHCKSALECKNAEVRDLQRAIQHHEQEEQGIKKLIASSCGSSYDGMKAEENGGVGLLAMVQSFVAAESNEKMQHVSEVKELRLNIEKLETTNTMTLTKMTELIDEKSASIQSLNTDIERLKKERDSLSDTVSRLQTAGEELVSKFELQESRLRDTVKVQLDANRKLMETNQAIKVALSKKDAQVIQLENSVTRLESRIMSYERERAHFSADEVVRDGSSSSATYSSQLYSQLAEEYDTIRKQLKSLQEQRGTCTCNEEQQHTEPSSHNAKAYLTERIRHLEVAKAHEEDKKRELLLVNAKLLQDQKQFRARTSTDAKEMVLLKEKINNWMLRDERRKKEQEQLVKRLRSLEEENQQLRRQHESQPPKPLPTDLNPKSSQLCSSAPPEETPSSPSRATSDDAVDQENVPPERSPMPKPDTKTQDKKRKLEDVSNHINDEQAASPNTAKSPAVEPVCPPTQLPANETTAKAVPRAKRRMSQFMSSRQSSSTTSSNDEKPAECQQQ